MLLIWKKSQCADITWGCFYLYFIFLLIVTFNYIRVLPNFFPIPTTNHYLTYSHFHLLTYSSSDYNCNLPRLLSATIGCSCSSGSLKARAGAGCGLAQGYLFLSFPLTMVGPLGLGREREKGEGG